MNTDTVSTIPGIGFDLDGIGDADRDTISHLLRAGIGEHSMRAIRSDIRYISTWHQLTAGNDLQWPPSRDTVILFIAHHLWDPEMKERNPDHGMPDDVRKIMRELGLLRTLRPHSPATVRRRMSTWASVCKWKNTPGPFDDPVVRRTLLSAIRVSKRPRVKKSAREIDAQLMRKIFEHLDHEASAEILTRSRRSLTAVRDKAMLAVCFASGGRRRSEVARMMMDDLSLMDPILENDVPIESLQIRLGRTKTTNSDDMASVFLNGPPVKMLEDWLTLSEVKTGAVFRAIDRWGNISKKRPGDEALNVILKQRIEEIGEDPRLYSAHGIRAGFITEAFKAGITAPEIMDQTLHRSVATTMSYYNDTRRRTGRAARLLCD